MNKSFNFQRFKLKTLSLLGMFLLFSKKTQIIYYDYYGYQDRYKKIPEGPITDYIVLPSTRLRIEYIKNTKILKGILKPLYQRGSDAYMRAYKLPKFTVGKEIKNVAESMIQLVKRPLKRKYRDFNMQPFKKNRYTFLPENIENGDIGSDLWGYYNNKIGIFALSKTSDIVFYKQKVFKRHNLFMTNNPNETKYNSIFTHSLFKYNNSSYACRGKKMDEHCRIKRYKSFDLKIKMEVRRELYGIEYRWVKDKDNFAFIRKDVKLRDYEKSIII